MSDSLGHHESQHTRPPSPSQTPRVYSNSCPSSRWCHPAISSSVIPFSSCPQSLPASGSFPIDICRYLQTINIPKWVYIQINVYSNIYPSSWIFPLCLGRRKHLTVFASSPNTKWAFRTRLWHYVQLPYPLVSIQVCPRRCFLTYPTYQLRFTGIIQTKNLTTMEFISYLLLCNNPFKMQHVETTVIHYMPWFWSWLTQLTVLLHLNSSRVSGAAEVIWGHHDPRWPHLHVQGLVLDLDSTWFLWKGSCIPLRGGSGLPECAVKLQSSSVPWLVLPVRAKH